MKKLIRSDENIRSDLPVELNIIVELDTYPYDVTAAEYKGLNIPDGELLPSEKGVKLSQQAVEDYQAFIESVEQLLTDYYDLKLYYLNRSADMSNYYGFVVKDDKGEPVLKFKFNLRVSNHRAHRSNSSQYNKQQAEKELAKITKGKKLKPIVKCVLVNKDEYDSYEDAIENIDSIVDRVVSIMKR